MTEAIPSFTSAGLLPVGVHECTMADIECRYLGNKHRQSLWDGFKLFLDQFRHVTPIPIVYVDGSFVSDKELPGDIDAVVEFRDFAHFVDAMVCCPILSEDHQWCKEQYGVDFYPCTEVQPGNDLRQYFQYVRPEDAIRRNLPPGSKKGMLRISAA